jgi:hypothetical protein
MDPSSRNAFLRWASLGMALAFIVGLVGGVTGWALFLGDRLGHRDDAFDQDTIEMLVGSDHVITADGAYNGTAVHAALGIESSGTGVFVATDLPVPSTGTGYQLWLFSNGTAHLAAVLTPDAEGDAVARLPDDLRAYDRIELDLEPVGSTDPGATRILAAVLP